MQPIAGENDILLGELMATCQDTVIDMSPALLEHGLIPDFTELDSSCSHAERASMTKSIFGARRYRSLLQTLR